MRFDDITTLNTNLEQQAIYFEQMAALKETQAARLRTLAKGMRNMASEEAHPDDPAIDARAFTLPAIARPKDAREEYGRGNLQPVANKPGTESDAA